MLHIVACIKQVPDTKVIKMNPKTKTMDRASAPAILNPYDAHAVEEAVRIRNKYGGTISVLTMGPPPAVKAIKKCIEIGADEGYMISDRAFAGADTLATSYALTKALEKIAKQKPIDLIICGKMTIDGDTGQVGPGIARRLDIPPLTSVNKVVEVIEEEKQIIVHRKLEDGYEVIQSSLPCLMAVEKEINEVPYSPLPNMLKAARYNPTIWAVDDLEDVDRKQLGLKGSPTIVSKVWAPEKPESGDILDGPMEKQVQKILNIVLEKEELFRDKIPSHDQHRPESDNQQKDQTVQNRTGEADEQKKALQADEQYSSAQVAASSTSSTGTAHKTSQAKGEGV